MTDNLEYRPLGWRDPEWYAYGVKDGVTWMTQKFASWFATAWLYLILWGVVLIAFFVLLYIDGIFSRSLAPDSIEPLSFQAMGWAYRLFAASFLMAAARCAVKGIQGKVTFRLLGAFASIIVCLHAFGFGFEALSDKRDNAEITVAVQDNLEGGVQARIDQYNKQIDGIRADRDAAIATAQAGIDSIKDEVPGLSADDNASIREFQEDKTEAQEAAAAEIAEIEGKIEALLAPPSEKAAVAQAEAKAEAEHAEKWHPLFVGLAQLANRTWNPTDNQVYIAAIIFIIFWVLLAESLVIFLPERIYVMHLKDAELSKASEAAKKGWDTRRKKAERSDPDHSILPQVEDTGYWQQRIMKALNNKMKRPTAKGLADSYFNGMSVEELRGRLHLHLKRGLVLVPATKSAPEVRLTHDHIDFIMREGEYAPEQQMTNGHDKGGTHEDDTDSDSLPATT